MTDLDSLRWDGFTVPTKYWHLLDDGRLNLFGALRTSLATCGYANIKEFQKAEVMVAPSLQTEGKGLQRSQQIGMGA